MEVTNCKGLYRSQFRSLPSLQRQKATLLSTSHQSCTRQCSHNMQNMVFVRRADFQVWTCSGVPRLCWLREWRKSGRRLSYRLSKSIVCRTLVSTSAFNYGRRLAGCFHVFCEKRWTRGRRQPRRLPTAHQSWPQAFNWATFFASQMTSSVRRASHNLYFTACQWRAKLPLFTVKWWSESLPDFDDGRFIPLFLLKKGEPLPAEYETKLIQFEIWQSKISWKFSVDAIAHGHEWWSATISEMTDVMTATSTKCEPLFSFIYLETRKYFNIEWAWWRLLLYGRPEKNTRLLDRSSDTFCRCNSTELKLQAPWVLFL